MIINASEKLIQIYMDGSITMWLKTEIRKDFLDW